MVVRLTEDEYEKMMDFCSRGNLSKERFWRKIVNGEKMQEKPKEGFHQLIYLLRCTASYLNRPKAYWNIKLTPDVKRSLELLDETEDILYYELLVHMREYIEKSWKKKGQLNAN